VATASRRVSADTNTSGIRAAATKRSLLSKAEAKRLTKALLSRK
jgi:hypothetical protein